MSSCKVKVKIRVSIVVVNTLGPGLYTLENMEAGRPEGEEAGRLARQHAGKLSC